jgi:hypothetical protein
MSFTRYCHVVAVLPHESLRLVADLVETLPEQEPYQTLKDRLLASHQLTRYQRAERLFAMPALGSRKPSEMMAAMLEVCPRGEEKTDLFACLFLQRLPRELRVLLARADHKEPKALADHADELWAFHVAPTAHLAALTLEGPGRGAHCRGSHSRRRPTRPRRPWKGQGPRSETAAGAAGAGGVQGGSPGGWPLYQALALRRASQLV